MCLCRERQREQEVRELEKQKEKDKERERLERERLEKQRAAEQAVHKHFEESLRLAQQKVSDRLVIQSSNHALRAALLVLPSYTHSFLIVPQFLSSPFSKKKKTQT